MWRALCRRELIHLMRGFGPATRVLRAVIAAGVFLPVLCGQLLGWNVLIVMDAWQMLLLSLGSAYLVVWIGEATERDWRNRESLAVSGVFPPRLFASKAIVGAGMGAWLGLAGLAPSWLHASFLHLGGGGGLQGMLLLAMGLGLTVHCSLWQASKDRARREFLPATLFAVLGVWLVPALASCFVRDFLGMARLSEILSPLAALAPCLTGRFGALTGAGPAGLALLSLAFFLSTLRRLGSSKPAKGIAFPNQPGETGFPGSGAAAGRRGGGDLRPIPPGRLACEPAFAGYAKRERAFFGILAACLFLQCFKPAWLWITWSALSVGCMYWSACVWHARIRSIDEECLIQEGSVLGLPDGVRDVVRRCSGLSLERGWWKYSLSSAVLTFLVGLIDGSAPWVVFGVVAVVLWQAPGLLGGCARDFARRASQVWISFVGLALLIAGPMVLGAMLSRFAGAKGFVAGTTAGFMGVVLLLWVAQITRHSSLWLTMQLAWMRLRTGGE
jgi:hypothetical protein